MNDTATREAHELRLEVGERLSQILTQAMTLISILGHQGYDVNIHVTNVQHENLKRGFLTGRIRCQHGLVLLPCIVLHVDDSLCQESRVLGRPSWLLIDECHAHLLGITNVAQECREIIVLASLHGDTIETIVLNTKALPTTIVDIFLDTLHVKTHVIGVVGMNRIVHASLQPSSGVSWADHLPGRAWAPSVALYR